MGDSGDIRLTIGSVALTFPETKVLALAVHDYGVVADAARLSIYAFTGDDTLSGSAKAHKFLGGTGSDKITRQLLRRHN